MRVLFCQPSSAKPAISGPERQTVQVARSLQARGHEVAIGVILVHPHEDVHSTTLAQHAAQYGIPTVPLYLPEKYNLLRSVRRFATLVEDWKPDVVCTQGYKADIIAALYGKVPTLVLTPGWTAKDWKVRLFEWLDKQTLRMHPAVGVVSPVQRGAVTRYGVGTWKIFYLPTALDMSALPPAYSRAEMSNILHSFQRGCLVGYVGRLSVEKGGQFLLESMPLVLQQRKDVLLLIVGEGDQRPVLQAQAQTLGIQEAVLFLGERADARQIIGALDLMVLPSLTEGMPNVILEAFAYKTPVVATAVGGVPELVKDGETGWLVPPRNPQALAQAIVEALSHPEEARRRAENAYRHLVENFTVEKQVDRWEQALQAAVENWKKRRG
ncbi:MAG: glycosyltransferase family 4 protein [Armatimonadota bacterium]